MTHNGELNVITHKPTKKIKVLSPTVLGKKHDKKLTDQEQYRIPVSNKLWQDTGFQGNETALEWPFVRQH